MSFLLLHVTQNMMFRSHRFRVKLRELMALGVSFHQSRIWNSDQFITWFRGGTERYQDTYPYFFSRVGAELRKFALQTSVSLATMPGSIPESMYIVFFPLSYACFPLSFILLALNYLELLSSPRRRAGLKGRFHNRLKLPWSDHCYYFRWW